MILGQVSYLSQRAHVPFEIGLDIAGLPKGCIAVGLCREFRVPTSEKALPQFAKDV